LADLRAEEQAAQKAESIAATKRQIEVLCARMADEPVEQEKRAEAEERGEVGEGGD
jgi:hypothetical protein